MVSKIETRKAELAAAQSEYDSVNADKDPDKWLEIYDRAKKLKKSLERLYKDFRVKIEASSIACGFCSDDNRDSNFYWCMRYEVARAAKDIVYTTKM